MLLDKETGELVFSDGFSLRGGMPMGGLDAPEPRLYDGVALLPECEERDGALCAVTLAALSGNAAKRRAALFTALGLCDPCPDTRLCVRFGCPFGELDISTDPYFGRTRARIQYRMSAAQG